MNCVIIDDETTARAIIKQLCTSVETLLVVEEFSNGIQAIKYLNNNKVDLIFLDIHMPNITGFEFIQILKNPPKIILTTSDSNFAIEAFEHDCIVDYLVKPILLERFQKAIQKTENILFNKLSIPYSPEKEALVSGNDLFINIDRKLKKIEISSIYLITAKGDYIIIRTDDENYIVHSTLKNIEEKLPADLFLKVHRSYIINIKEIIDIEDNCVLIRKKLIPLSRPNKKELIKRLNLL